jgi:hypothetical protein
MSNPGEKYDQSSIETACDIGFLVSRIYFPRRDEEKAKLEGLELEREIDLATKLAKSIDSLPDRQRAQALSKLGRIINQKAAAAVTKKKVRRAS